MLNKILALLFDKFKQNSPTTAAFLLLCLGVIQFTVTDALQLGINVPEWAPKAVEIVTFVLAALTGSRTFKFIAPKENEDHNM